MIGIGVNISPFLNKVARTVANYYNRVISDGATIESLECVNTNLSQLDSKNLLDSASLVMIPSGYKEDIVYSEVPSSNAGDLSFTRASDGTRINSAGLVEVVPWNLVQNSENFSIDFIPINASISNNTTTAPNGTTTADSLIENTATDNHFAFGDSTQQSGVEYTYSVYAKSIGGRNIRVLGSSGFGGDVIVDLANGSVLSGSGVVQSVGNGWYRISITATTTTATVRIILYTVNGTSISYTGNGTSGVFLWGAQLNIGSTAKPYFPTTDRLNVPRLTYQNGGGGCPSLLLEKQSTNLALYSQALSTSPNIVDSSTVTANVYISPDGTQNAMQFTETTANNRHGFYQYTTVTAQTYTASIFTKQTGRRYISLDSDMTGTQTASFFDLQTINVVSSGSGHTCSIQDFGNGWLRLNVTITAVAGSRFIIWCSSTNGTTNVYAGSTSFSQTFWGYQLEASSYPTSYIPTTSASATRVKDAIGNQTTSIAQAFTDNSKGTVFFDLRNIKIGGADAARFRFGDSSSSLQFALYIGPIGVGVYSYKATAGFVISQSTTSAQKLAVKFDGNTIVGFSNGVKRNTITASSSFSIDQMTDNDTGDLCWEKNQFILFNAVLTDAECISLTTI